MQLKCKIWNTPTFVSSLSILPTRSQEIKPKALFVLWNSYSTQKAKWELFDLNYTFIIKIKSRTFCCKISQLLLKRKSHVFIFSSISSNLITFKDRQEKKILNELQILHCSDVKELQYFVYSTIRGILL